jgi:hypothetical protein
MCRGDWQHRSFYIALSMDIEMTCDGIGVTNQNDSLMIHKPIDAAKKKKLKLSPLEYCKWVKTSSSTVRIRTQTKPVEARSLDHKDSVSGKTPFCFDNLPMRNRGNILCTKRGKQSFFSPCKDLLEANKTSFPKIRSGVARITRQIR